MSVWMMINLREVCKKKVEQEGDEALATAAEKYRYWVKYLVMMASQTTKMDQFLTPVVFHHVGFFFMLRF